jgi:plastocyanin
MNNKIFIGLVVLAAGVLVGWYFFKGNVPGSKTTNVTQTPTPSGSNLGTPAANEATGSNSLDKGGVKERVVVTLTDTGFAPSPVTVKAGTIVTFVNESNGQMWIASDPHPIHSLLPGFDELASVDRGGTYEYTFTKVGTWTYHNHRNPSTKGTVIVTE